MFVNGGPLLREGGVLEEGNEDFLILDGGGGLFLDEALQICVEPGPCNEGRDGVRRGRNGGRVLEDKGVQDIEGEGRLLLREKGEYGQRRDGK